jgi:signal transduction histidine kinase
VVTHVVGIIHDITETRAAQRALEKAKLELEERVAERTRALEMAQDELLRKERLAVLGQLTGGLAHQIRNPLSAILNASRELRRLATGRPEDQKELDAVLAIIDEEVWSANRIVTDLIDYARVKEAHRRPVALLALLKPLLAQLPPEIQIDKVIPEDLPLLDVDGPQVSGALGNLLRNAHEAMPLGGFLKIEAKRVGVGRASIALTDSGPGLTNQALGRLFEPLVTSKPLGLGLGLVTAKSLIENQGGRLEGGNVPGGGARFIVLLPVVLS